MIPEILYNILTPAEDYTFGTADLTGIVAKRLGEFHYRISIGKKLDDRIMDSATQRPTLMYLHNYHQMNNLLQQLAKRVQSELLKAGINRKKALETA